MFEAGSSLEDKEAKDIFYADFKPFSCGDISFGIGQGSFVSERSIQQAKELLLPYLDEVLQKEELDLVCYMLTNVLESSTELIFAGEHAGEIVALGFSPDAMEEHSAVLPGVVSRKKQMVPNLSRGISDWQANN